MNEGSIYKDSRFKEVIAKQERLISMLNGEWVTSPNKYILCNHYIGLNQITHKKEVYINIYIKASTIEEIQNDFFSIIKDIEEKYSEAEYFYIEIFPEDTAIVNKIYELMEYLGEYRILQVMIEKTLLSNPDLSYKNDLKVKLREAETRDIDNILNCIINAYKNGITGYDEKSIDLELMYRNIEEYYSNIGKNEKNFSLICEIGGDFCGHATYELEEYILSKDRRYARLIDIFILEKYSKMGFSKLLGRYGEKVCLKKGINKIFGSVKERNKTKTIELVEMLKKENWNEQSIVYIRAIGE